MLRKTLLIAFSAFGLALGACGDDTAGNPDTGLDAIFPDVVGGDGVNPLNDTTNPQAVLRLDFEQAFGDDQLPCRNTSRCSISLSFNERRTLSVFYTQDGVPTAGRVVKYAIEQDPDNVGAVNTLSSVTGEDGVAEVEARNQGSRVGQYVLRAYIDNNDVPPIYFDIAVTPKGQVPLTVGASYAGTEPVSTFAVNLYRQNAAGVPKCNDLGALLRDAQASQTSPAISLAQTFKFTTFDHLQEDGTQRYTILVFSRNMANAVQAWGCDDTKGVVKWVEPTTVVVPMTDRPPSYRGDYDITSRFDFISAIPEPYRTWVEYLVGFFRSPTQTVFQLACDLLGGFQSSELSGFCGTLFTRGSDGSVQPGTLGGFVFDLVDNILNGLVQGTTFGTVLQAGGDVGDILKAFDMAATLKFLTEPDGDGVWTVSNTQENWHTVKVKWSLGANCDPVTEANCGLRTFSFAEMGEAPVTGSFPASVANRWDLSIGMHPLNIRYGALINYILEGVLLPVFTGQPTVDSYEELLGFLVGGGVACVNTGDPENCCIIFADKTIGNDSGAIDTATETAVNAACKTILTTGSSFLRTTIKNLALPTGDAFRLGTKTTCRLTDFNNDLCVDGIGSAANPCTWDVRLSFGSSATTTIDATFWGARSSACPQ